MSNNPLFSQLLSLVSDGDKLSYNQFVGFVSNALGDSDNFHNFDAVTGVVNRAHNATILYSGTTDGVYNGNIAKDIADRAGGDVRVIDNTKMGRLLGSITNGDALNGLVEGNLDDFKDFANKQFEPASKIMVSEAKGKIVTILGKDAELNNVFGLIETPEILKTPDITHVNNEAISDVKKITDGLSGDGQRAFLLGHFENTYANNIQDAGLSVWEKPAGSNGFSDRAAVDYDAATLSKLGVDAPLDPIDTSDLTKKLDVNTFKAELQYLRVKGAHAAEIALKGEVNVNWNALFDEGNVVQVQRNKWQAEALKNVDLGAPQPEETASKLWKQILEHSTDASESAVDTVKALARWQKSFFDAFPDYFDGLPDSLVKIGKTALGHYKQYWDDTIGLFKFDGNVAKFGLKLTGAAAGVLLGVLDGVAEYKKAGGAFNEQFATWLAITAGTTLAAIPIVGSLASAAIAASPVWGTIGVVTIAVGGFYYGVRSVAANLVEAYKDDQGSLIYTSAKSVLDFMKELEGSALTVLKAIGSLFVSAAHAGELENGFEKIEVSSVQVVGAEAAAYTYGDDTSWLFGEDNGVIIGGDEDNWLFHTGSGEAIGGAGDDILIAWKPDYIFKGEYINAKDRAQAEANKDLPEDQQVPIDGPIAQQDLRLTLNGGDGDDWLIALGGTGAILVGGEGRDFLFNTSEYGQLWGDGFGGRPVDNPATPENENLGDTDVFWYWPGTFIMDAQQNDILQMFGWPLTGGTNTLTGLPGVDGFAIDWTVWSTFYAYTDANQLIIFNALAYILGIGPEGLKGQMIVENFDFGGTLGTVTNPDGSTTEAYAKWGVPAVSDLGMTFRMVLGKDNPNGVEISVWNAMWGHLITLTQALTRLAKLVNWQPADDPLVLDLDGDGIETVSVNQSGVHFDLDGDYFAEKTGWVGADDGFLVRDLNGNGVIDDITEMFGAPGVSSFSELAELDKVENGGNADGFLTLDDAAFSELQVWRDLDQDGETDIGGGSGEGAADGGLNHGELFGLDELDIVSISVTGDGVESITPTGTTLREGASFSFADGTTGNTYEALFETDASDTIFRGERGVAANTNRIDDLGYVA